MGSRALFNAGWPACALLLCASCSSPGPPAPDPTMSVHGPCTISGTLTVRAPVLKTGSTSSALDNSGTLEWPLDAHLYFSGGSNPARFLYINDYNPWRTADPASGVYTIELEYEDLPYGSYEIQIGTWEVHVPVSASKLNGYDTSRSVVLSDGPITLSADQPHSTGRSLAIDLGGGDCRAGGKVLFDGWGPVVLYQHLVVQTVNGPGLDQYNYWASPQDIDCSWLLSTLGIPDGRMYFEISGLRAGDYQFQPPWPSINWDYVYDTKFSLDEEHPYARRQLLSANPTPSVMRELDLNSLTGRVYFTGWQDWAGDMAIIASATSGETGPGYQARQWLRQELIAEGVDPGTYSGNLALNPRLDVQGAVLLSLGALFPGEYRLSAWLYSDQPGESLELELADGPYALPSGEVPKDYQWMPGRLEPWETNIHVELNLSESDAFRFLD